jgi:hypothetical protein
MGVLVIASWAEKVVAGRVGKLRSCPARARGEVSGEALFDVDGEWKAPVKRRLRGRVFDGMVWEVFV